MSKFTPGPWKLSPALKTIVANYESIHSLTYVAKFTNSCSANWQDNAKLIAAAPEMYQALKELISLTWEEDPSEGGCYCTDNCEPPIVCGWCKAKAALAKAEGR